MAFDFLGTFNLSQYTRFIAFADKQLQDVQNRIVHLQYELERMGSLSFSYGANGEPLAFETGGKNTYLGKLMAAYTALGGDPFFDLNIRSLSQAVFLQRAREMSTAQLMSNGEVMGMVGLADGVSASLMQDMRVWLDQALKFKRERLEHKIRRAVDYSGQLENEINFLTDIVKSAESLGSWEQLKVEMKLLFEDPTYRAIYDDKGTDPYGKLTYAPFKPYFDDGSDGFSRKPSDVFGRDLKGATVPGQKGK